MTEERTESLFKRTTGVGELGQGIKKNNRIIMKKYEETCYISNDNNDFISTRECCRQMDRAVV